MRSPLPRTVGLPRAAVLLGAVLALAACRPAPDDGGYAARVGDAVLTEAELAQAVAAMPPSMDAEAARLQYVEQWVTGQLLAREARRRGLLDDPDVVRQLRDNERNVLAAALLGSLYDEDPTSFTGAELEAYFERNRERMRLREPYVRVRYVEARSAADAEAARREMIELYTGSFDGAARDSAFALAARRYAIDTTAALALAESYVPQSRLSRQSGGPPWGMVTQMGPRETGPVTMTSDSTYFVVQLVERVPAGGEPRLEWVADEVGRRLAIQSRQQLVAREVQRLRTEATARGDLSIPIAAENP